MADNKQHENLPANKITSEDIEFTETELDTLGKLEANLNLLRLVRDPKKQSINYIARKAIEEGKRFIEWQKSGKPLKNIRVFFRNEVDANTTHRLPEMRSFKMNVCISEKQVFEAWHYTDEGEPDFPLYRFNLADCSDDTIVLSEMLRDDVSIKLKAKLISDDMAQLDFSYRLDLNESEGNELEGEKVNRDEDYFVANDTFRWKMAVGIFSLLAIKLRMRRLLLNQLMKGRIGTTNRLNSRSLGTFLSGFLIVAGIFGLSQNTVTRPETSVATYSASVLSEVSRLGAGQEAKNKAETDSSAKVVLASFSERAENNRKRGLDSSKQTPKPKTRKRKAASNKQAVTNDGGCGSGPDDDEDVNELGDIDDLQTTNASNADSDSSSKETKFTRDDSVRYWDNPRETEPEVLNTTTNQ